ncbi:hypothetical protein [Rhodovulum euryhalinum]|uniref:Tat pathway signal sequence domain protein n=1 Tax=Rhodovulum euryhalinum TaxID=35805 RepID=A0A4R2KNI4_9RHOB|nr:hypothetical protein [Rhodovulum euryhalinum]TCO74137.1 hypothetical protein EV655_101298 [Rhodovulum euryhalinum]
MILKTRVLLLAAGLAAQAQPAMADDPPAARLSLELNAVAETEGGCLLSFVATNGHGTDIDSAVFETVLMDGGGRVDRLTLLDFGALPAGRPRVRQFVVPNLACGDLGRVLVNGASACAAGDLGEAACTEGLILTTRTDVELVG